MVDFFKKFSYCQRGFSTIEILIAMALIIMAISTVLPLVFSSQSAAISSQTNQEALYKVQELLENARANAKLDFNLVNPIAPVADTIFQKSLSVEQVDFYTKKVIGIASWQGENNQSLTVGLSTLITNPNAVESGDTCGSVLSGDWVHPAIISYELGKDLLGDVSSGFPISSIDLNNRKIYVTVNNSSGNNFPNFFIFDVANPTQPPVFISSMDNNPNVKAGLNAVKVSGNYAYVANANGANYTTCVLSLSCSQLQIIDLTTMAVVGKLKIPGVTGKFGQAIGTAIFYRDGFVYLGLAKSITGPEFAIIDVGGGGMGGSPANPVYLGGISIGAGVNKIIVKGAYAYVASPDDEELKVINISNPSFPVQVGQFNAPLGGGNNGNGKSLYLVGNTLYFGRTLLNGDEFYILNDINPETSLPVLVARDVKNQNSNNTSVNGIIVRDYLIFLLTNDDFQVLQVDSPTNPSAILPYSTPLSTPGGSGTAIDCEENYIYFASLPSNDKGYIVIVNPGP